MHQIEYSFSNVKAALEEMPGFHYSAFTKNRTQAQLAQLSRQVLLAVKRGIKADNIHRGYDGRDQCLVP